ncbi:hypothetical protein HYC85_030831 [Camellia sinensis]|uniref:Clathrin adaptor alpha-adaptin appendage C-terminal subdomain domain-containing protein n=1 Tax=Camellia sinensis TaxID=4442 RepID=A0A7J7G1R3_CAMSI|nr:hypothetical protein HYC85_030831 [Camellia sinensis]
MRCKRRWRCNAVRRWKIDSGRSMVSDGGRATVSNGGRLTVEDRRLNQALCYEPSVQNEQCSKSVVSCVDFGQIFGWWTIFVAGGQPVTSLDGRSDVGCISHACHVLFSLFAFLALKADLPIEREGVLIADLPQSYPSSRAEATLTGVGANRNQCRNSLWGHVGPLEKLIGIKKMASSSRGLLTLFPDLNESTREITGAVAREPQPSAPEFAPLTFPMRSVEQRMAAQSDIEANQYTLKSCVETMTAVTNLSHRLQSRTNEVQQVNAQLALLQRMYKDARAEICSKVEKLIILLHRRAAASPWPPAGPLPIPSLRCSLSTFSLSLHGGCSSWRSTRHQAIWPNSYGYQPSLSSHSSSYPRAGLLSFFPYYQVPMRVLSSDGKEVILELELKQGEQYSCFPRKEQVGHEFINLRPSRDVAVLDFSYKFGTHVNVKLRLPAVFNKFLQPVTVSAEEFFPQWRSLAGPPLKLQEVVRGVRPMSLAEMANLFYNFRLMICPGLDPNANNLVASTIFFQRVQGPCCV